MAGSFEDDEKEKRKILELLTVANEYCMFVEKADEYDTAMIYDYLIRLLPLLYLKATLLPMIIPENEDSGERIVTEQQWEDLFNVLKNKFGKDDAMLCYRPHESYDEQAVKASLAENLSDIYQDMKDTVTLFTRNTFTARENAIHQCYWLFRKNWGSKALECLLHMHYLVFGGDEKETE